MSILIDNFSMEVEEWLPVADLGSFSVDAVETASGVGISTSGTYFIHDGQIVSTTYSGITGGYTCYYTPSGVYSDGTIDLTIHVEKTASGVSEQTFYLLYGYNAIFEDWVGWGPNVQVDIRAQASNSVRCSNTVGEGFYFITADLEAVNLGATIRAIESVDLGAKIYPQSTAFFYGETYTGTISGVTDFAGNIMDPYTYMFMIEDPNN